MNNINKRNRKKEKEIIFGIPGMCSLSGTSNYMHPLMKHLQYMTGIESMPIDLPHHNDSQYLSIMNIEKYINQIYEEILKIMEEKKKNKTHIVGHSMGATIGSGVESCIENNQSINMGKLITINAPYTYEGTDVFSKGAALLFSAGPIFQPGTFTYNPKLAKWLICNDMSDQDADKAIKGLGPESKKVLWDYLFKRFKIESPERNPEDRLHIASSQDHIVPNEISQKIATITGGHYEEIPGGHHSVVSTTAKETAELIAELTDLG